MDAAMRLGRLLRYSTIYFGRERLLRWTLFAPSISCVWEIAPPPQGARLWALVFTYGMNPPSTLAYLSLPSWTRQVGDGGGAR